MPTIDQFKEQESTPTPLFLFDCVLPSGDVERWGTHGVTFEGHAYLARLMRHNLFDLSLSSEDGFDGASKISVTLANADSRYSQIERETGFKGAQVTVRFLFFDLVAGTAASEARVVFRGISDSPDETTEAALRMTFNNRLSLQRIVLPEVSIGRRCPWLFPATPAQRLEAMDGGAKGKYSALYRCGYSADQTGGAGNLNAGAPYTSCDYSRASCTARGMFDEDSASHVTRRFGGVEFVPAQILVRSFGEQGTHLSPLVDNEALYNDVVPLVYGTAWLQPPVVFARNDGNLTRMEVLLGLGEIEGVYKVIVNNIEIPEGVSGADMTATGWFTVVSHGSRTGAFNGDFSDSSGNPLGDPYGSMALLSVVVPNQISKGQTLAQVRVLMNGLKLERFDDQGVSLGEAFTNNPAWVALDLLRRSGWQTSEVDLKSFAAAGAVCAETVSTVDLYGNSAPRPRYQCNLVVQKRRSGAELVKGVRAASALQLTYGVDGMLTLRAENTLTLQQPQKPGGSNSTATLDGGWPAYEFSDGSAAFSGIMRRSSGEPAVRVYTRNGAAAPNRLSVEFQDEFNEFQQDSLSLVDVDDALLTGRQVAGSFSGLGLPNFDQASRALGLQLAKSIKGNLFVDFDTTVRGVGLAPGDLITITYLKEGWARQPFRIVRIAPGMNYQTVTISAQWHDDGWYSGAGGSAAGGRRRDGADLGVPRPLVGTVVDANGIAQFGITEQVIPTADGGFSVRLEVEFSPPEKPATGGPAIPLVGLTPQISASGGTFSGGQTLYYAVSATNSSGAESDLSFSVRALIPAGTNTNSVTITGLSFSPATTGFKVYRGPSPSQLLLIATATAVTASYTDTGAVASHVGPPDDNYDHANFFWRLELQPEESAGIHSATTIGNGTLAMLSGDFNGGLVRITRGRGLGQERAVVSNTTTTITVTPAWTVEPDTASYFTVADGTWKFAGIAAGSPVEIEAPNKPGATVQISGRSANVHDRESSYQLNPVTRWQIGGGSLGGVDTDTPPKPVFGLNPAGQGSLELLSVGFTDLTNTHTITAGTLSLFCWNELSSPTAYSLSGAATSTDTTISLNAAGPAAIGTLVQIENEIVEVAELLSGGTQYRVTRAAYGSTAAAHASGTLAYHQTRSIFIVPFVKGFFGSLASGSYRHSMFLPDVRVGAVELFMTNAVGHGMVATGSFGGLVDHGLRTLSGGQISIQVEGYLATQVDAAPALVMEDSHAARDMFATVREAPVGGPVQLRLRQGSTVYRTLTIADGATISNVVDGFGLPPLAADAQLSLDITSVPSAVSSLPGRDLTVTIRL